MEAWSGSYKAPEPQSSEQSVLSRVLLFAIGVLCAIYAYTWIQTAQKQDKLEEALAAEPIESFSSEVRFDSGNLLFTENIVVQSQGQRLKHGIGRYLKTKQSFGEARYEPSFLVINGEKLPLPSAKPAGAGQVYFLGNETTELPAGRNEFLFQYVASGLVESKDGQQTVTLDLLGPAITDTKSVQAVIYPPALVTKEQIRATGRIISAQMPNSPGSASSVSVEIISPPNPSPGSDNQSGAVKVSNLRPLTLGELVQVQVSWPQF